MESKNVPIGTFISLCIKTIMSAMRNRHAEKITSNLVKLLKEKRLEKGMSHQTLADAAGVDRSTISRVESGKRMPTILVCLKITDALGESLPDLIKKADR